MKKRSKKATSKLNTRELPKVVKGIVLPQKNKIPPTTEFVKSLKIGESFLVGNLSKAQNYFRLARLNKMRIVQRRVDAGSQTLRLWRVE